MSTHYLSRYEVTVKLRLRLALLSFNNTPTVHILYKISLPWLGEERHVNYLKYKYLQNILGLGDNTIIRYTAVSKNSNGISFITVNKKKYAHCAADFLICPAPMYVWLCFQFNSITI